MEKEEPEYLPGYPKAKYRLASEGEGDLKFQYAQDRHPYVSAVARSPRDEEKLGPNWFDRPDLVPVPIAEDVAEERPRRGRPPKVE